MNFFEHQARARKRTTWYVLLFIVATLSIIAAVDIVIVIAASLLMDHSYDYLNTGQLPSVPLSVIGWTSMITVSVIGGAILYRLASLSGGGGKVARDVGGTLVDRMTGDPKRRQLLNVVEETAIAAGMPVPEVYVLEQESGINAFAAGYTTSDAAIAVTRGALEHFTRDELQGVIGHEFSHILNGDTRLNTRLIGVLFGIMFIGLAGRLILRSRLRGRGALPILSVGLALLVIGYVGALFGQMIQAAISRSRERLADASAVQFTRNAHGLAGALKKIAVLSGAFNMPRASEVSHMLIADRSAGFNSFFSSHPPLLERIRAIEPSFRPNQLERVSRTPVAPPQPAAIAPKDAAAALSAVPVTAAAIAATVGQIDKVALDTASLRISGISPDMKDIAHTSSDAISLTVAFVLSQNPAERTRQIEFARKHLGLSDEVVVRTEFLGDKLARLEAVYRLPLFEMAFPSLRSCSTDVLRKLAATVEALANTDGVISVFEYALTRLLRVQLYEVLAPQARRAPMVAPKLYALRGEVQAVLSVVAREGIDNAQSARAAYDSGIRRLFSMDAPAYQASADWRALDRALTRLDFLDALVKQQLVEALAATVSHDRSVTLGEFELLRAVCGSLHCPLPLLTPAVQKQAAA